MSVFFRRLSDEKIEDACFELLLFLLKGTDPHLKVSNFSAIKYIFLKAFIDISLFVFGPSVSPSQSRLASLSQSRLEPILMFAIEEKFYKLLF